MRRIALLARRDKLQGGSSQIKREEIDFSHCFKRGEVIDLTQYVYGRSHARPALICCTFATSL